MKAVFASLLVATLAVPGVAPARGGQQVSNPLSYNYLRISRIRKKSSYFDDRDAGFRLKASFAVGQHVYLLASASHLTFDTLPGGEHTYSLGIGYQENPMGNTSGFLQAEFFHENAETAPSPHGNHIDGWARFSWGFRTLFGQNSPWEVDGAVYYDAHDDFGGRNFGVWAGLGVVWDSFGVRLLANHNGVQDSVRLSLSLYF